jgi:hypothetical protein
MSFNRDMLTALRKAGFKRAWLQRSTLNGDACQYTRWEDDRLIEVQLEADATQGHRASNMLIIANDRRRLRGTTHPTPFTDVLSMLAAIEHERTRKDHKA